MIAKKFKVPRSKIVYLLEKGASYKSKFFIIRHEKNEELFPRFCVIISRKMDKSAVTRNRLKRQIFESLRLGLKEGETNNNLDLILIPKKIILESKFEDINADLMQIYKRLKITHG